MSGRKKKNKNKLLERRPRRVLKEQKHYRETGEESDEDDKAG
jgi:hypothetical protein